jgi:hypothetical protein
VRTHPPGGYHSRSREIRHEHFEASLLLRRLVGRRSAGRGLRQRALAFRVSGKLDWDSANLRFTNSAEANQNVKPVFRKGWEMKL